MRDDFHSVLTEGDGVRYPDAARKRVAIRDDDGNRLLPNAHFRELSKGWHEGHGHRSAALHRFLRSRLGRPWDAVHSELCAGLRASPIRGDVLHSLRWVVERRCRLDAGGAVVCGRGRPVSGFYVCPVDATLRETPPRCRRGGYMTRQALRAFLDPERLDLGETHVLEVVHGAWFERRWELVPHRVPHIDRNGVRRVLLRMLPGAAIKRQLSRGEARRLGLREWADLARSLDASIEGRAYDAKALKALKGIRDSARSALARKE